MVERDGILIDSGPGLEMTLPLGSIPQARIAASSYVSDVAEALMAEVGFAFVASDSPPTSLDELHRAVAHSTAESVPLPVPNHLHGDTALTGMEGDQPLAFWRSIVKVRDGYGFTRAEELSLDLDLLDRAAFDGVSRPARAVLYAALVGTTVYTAIKGATPSSPRQFTSDVLTYGLTDAILLENERSAPSRRS
ncbi:hypothetical protein [Agreia sp. VKM Ac-1783]|uniref:hypothetical protein n=1 Tax=Agreia sp. VKM Ac-1783 TaxID=1938889 RepID=UPI000A2AB271|nr:hypothetical protein [Agreia sp. VKM Ac-1783]SMQ71886.1 hypothetical protein SAMN06295943_2773 [Agreia sp. VKM Ac-1783]